jgi:hypothetical protein
MFYFRSTYSRRAGNLEYRLDPNTTGKWVIIGNRGYVGSIWKKAREMVKEGELYEIKYSRISKGIWSLLIYADSQTKEDFLSKIIPFNNNPYWINNAETRLKKRKK